MFDPTPETTVGKRGRDLVDFLRQVSLFVDLARSRLHSAVYQAGCRYFWPGPLPVRQQLSGGIPGSPTFQTLALHQTVKWVTPFRLFLKHVL